MNIYADISAETSADISAEILPAGNIFRNQILYPPALSDRAGPSLRRAEGEAPIMTRVVAKTGEERKGDERSVMGRTPGNSLADRPRACMRCRPLKTLTNK